MIGVVTLPIQYYNIQYVVFCGCVCVSERALECNATNLRVFCSQKHPLRNASVYHVCICGGRLN